MRAAAGGRAAAQTPQGTSFTYQGRLGDGGALAEGAFDFQFILYDAAVGGSQVGPIVTRLATVRLPEWFETLNRDFRYQLTVLGDGEWARARVLRKIADNAFVVQTDLPRVELSWQVTGIRQDPYAEKHRIPVEEDKPDHERGTYLNPEAWGVPVERGIDHRRTAAIP